MESYNERPFRLISINCRGLGNAKKLMAIILRIIAITSTLSSIVICFQECKLACIPEEHIKILSNFNLDYHYHASDRSRSGGLLTCWDNNLGNSCTVNANEHSLALHFDTLDTTIINVYCNQTRYQASVDNVLKTCKAIEHQSISNIFLVGDINAYSVNPDNRSSSPPRF